MFDVTRELFRASGISDMDTKRMISGWMKWKRFALLGGINEDNGLNWHIKWVYSEEEAGLFNYGSSCFTLTLTVGWKCVWEL